MGQILCHNKGRYNFYLTVSDGFRFVSSLDLGQVEYVIKCDYGRNGLDNLNERLERAHKNGHSCITGGALKSFLSCNRAGENEKRLSCKECVERFLS